MQDVRRSGQVQVKRESRGVLSGPISLAWSATVKFTTQNWNQPCELLLRARLVPDRAGADTQVIAHISLRDLRAMDGASSLEDVWIRALVGEDGYLTGKDAEAAACDALIVPAVTGTMDTTALATATAAPGPAAAARRPGATCII